MGAFITVCFDALDTYGKTPDQLKNITKLFLLTLAEYPAQLVRRAFERWVCEKTKMPTPSDIVGIIQEDNAPLMDLVQHVRAGLKITAEADDYVTSKLGKNWREKYV